MTNPFHSLKLIQAQILNETRNQLIEVLRQIASSDEHFNIICKYLDQNPTLIENLQNKFVSEPEYSRWFQRVVHDVGLYSQDLPSCLQNLTILERRRCQDKMIDDARRRRRHNIINEFAKQLSEKHV
jgi:hypothetical protein